MKIVIFVMCAVMVVSRIAAAQAPPQSMAVPAFFSLSHSTNGSTYDWIRIKDAARAVDPWPSAVKIVVAEIDVIGAGFSSGDPCTNSPAAMFNCLRQRGVLILGYVPTDHSRRDNPCPGDVLPSDWQAKSKVLHAGSPTVADDGYASVYKWYTAYDGYIDGIFFDEGPSLEQGGCRASMEQYQKDYYGHSGAGLYQAVRNAHSGPCGGRACVMTNASQFPKDWVMSTANFATLWEKELASPSPSPQGYLPPRIFCPCASSQSCSCAAVQNPEGWYAASGGSGLHLVHSSGTTPDINAIACTSTTRGGPMMYVHDTGSNNYGHLAPYFEDVGNALRNCPNDTPCGGGYIDSCGADCGFGTWCPPGEICTDFGGYYGCTPY